MLEILFGLLSSTGFGAITGLIGSIATKVMEYKTLGRKLEYDVQMAEIRQREVEAEQSHELAMADKQMERAQVEGQLVVDAEEMRAFTESQKQNKVGEGPMAAVRSLVRPVVTFYLLTACTVLTYLIWKAIGGLDALPTKELVEIFRHTIYTIFFLASTAVTWYFGSRPSSQRGTKP